MGRKHFLFLMSAVFCVLMAFSPRAAYAAPPSDPCSLLTPAQVSAVLGVNVGEGQRMAPTLCEWSVSGQSGPGSKKVTVTLQNPQAFAYAKMPVGHGITKTPVSGIGDDAVYGTTPNFAATLTVKKGDVVFAVRVFGFPIAEGKSLDEVQAKEKTLALEILSKL
jgi:hypothetical protein